MHLPPYYATACVVCLNSSIKEVCNNCNMAAYCSVSHQILHQNEHARFCRRIYKMQPNCQYVSPQTNIQAKVTWVKTVQRALGRPLRRQEKEMCLYPNVCNVCYSMEVIFSCMDCKIISYCSCAHEISDKIHHSGYCHQFAVALALDQYLVHYKMPEVQFNRRVMSPPKVIPSNTNNMIPYIRFKKDFIEKRTYLHSSLVQDARYLLKHYPIGLGLSILYALKESKIGHGTFVIHIVGASKLEKETNWSVVTEMLMYWTNITHITYHLIGPEVMTYRIRPQRELFYAVVCHHQYYHDVHEDLGRPNMIAMFNALLSIHEEPILEDKISWDPTLPKLFEYKYVPLIITSYTLVGIQGDMTLINAMKFKLRYIRHPAKNPYSFLYPKRNWCFDGNPIYYKNQYISIIERID